MAEAVEGALDVDEEVVHADLLFDRELGPPASGLTPCEDLVDELLTGPLVGAEGVDLEEATLAVELAELGDGVVPAAELLEVLAGVVDHEDAALAVTPRRAVEPDEPLIGELVLGLGAVDAHVLEPEALFAQLGLHRVELVPLANGRLVEDGGEDRLSSSEVRGPMGVVLGNGGRADVAELVGVFLGVADDDAEGHLGEELFRVLCRGVIAEAHDDGRGVVVPPRGDCTDDVLIAAHGAGFDEGEEVGELLEDLDALVWGGEGGGVPRVVEDENVGAATSTG